MLQKEKETLTKLVQKFKTQEVCYDFLQLSYLLFQIIMLVPWLNLFISILLGRACETEREQNCTTVRK